MMLSGIIGLFVGAVILSLGYMLFQAWPKNITNHSEKYSKPMANMDDKDYRNYAA